MSEGVEGAPDTPAVLDSMTAAVVDAMRVETAWIEPLDAVTAEDAAMRMPLVHRGARLGDLAVVVPAGRTFSAADVALLHDLARHAAVVVHAVRLTEALQGVARPAGHHARGGAAEAAPRPSRRARAEPRGRGPQAECRAADH